ncbi:hypothetical protein SVA_0728 [Sulfurifustis variabilis]|uniref:Lipoprotein n=1 Tax=Sulfurifustis variabilis TaxID=1675686 RepID=A0A1B4VD36_9GAMM|nr:hypothetical protein [Sulfurifustis variabilis]BAU47307.1 hypothetical protein SVA_0728 [Sulfurifustis variabilis]
MTRFLSTAFLAACALAACTHAAGPEKGTALYFVEEEEGTEAGGTRMLITREYLRIDDGVDAGDFLLYQRADKTIYSVNAADGLVLVIGHQPVKSAATGLTHDVQRRNGEPIPDVAGRKVVHYRLLTNGQLCYDLYAAEGLLPDAVAALAEYRESLAGEQAVALASTPKEMQSPCDLANNVYLPARHLAHGFPIRLTETTRNPVRTRTTELVDYKTGLAIDPELFRVPQGYRRLTIQELRAR